MNAILARAKPHLRRVQSLVLRVTKGVTFGVRGFVTDGEGGILLVRHSYVPGWHIPGGAVDPGETAMQAVARELSEEAAIAPEGEMHLLGLYFNRGMANRDHVAVYHVPLWRRLRTFQPNREILESRFFAMTDLPSGTAEGTLRRIAEFRGESAPGPYW